MSMRNPMSSLRRGALAVVLLSAGCTVDGDLGSRQALGVEQTPGQTQAPADGGAAAAPPVRPTAECAPTRPPPAQCVPSPNPTEGLGLAEACVVAQDGAVLSPWGAPAVIPPGSAGVLAVFNDLVPRVEDSYALAFAGPLRRDAGPQPTLRPCWTTLADRRAIWVTLEDSIPAGTPVNIVVQFPSTHPAVNAPHVVPNSRGLGGAIFRFSTSP
jgi:hypothetical protein